MNMTSSAPHSPRDTLNANQTNASADSAPSERLQQFSKWVDATGALGKDGAWNHELQAIVAGKGK
jgi:hypothetical protein